MIIDMRLRAPYKGLKELSIWGEHLDFFYSSLRVSPPPSVKQRSMELLLKEMDEAGIAYGVCAARQSPPPLGSVSNDEMAELVAMHPDRFVGLACVDISNQTIDRCVAELDRGVRQLGLRGLSFEPVFADPPRRPDDPYLYPIYEKCVELGVSVTFTTGPLVGPDMTWTSPIDFSHLARDFPTLPIILGHACWPLVQEVLGVAFRHPNIHLQPDVYSMRGMPGVEEYVKAANLFLQDRFLFGTAYPIYPLREGVKWYQELPFTDVVREKVFYQTGARLMKIGQ